MSMFDTGVAACPNCGAEAEFEAVLSVNADRRPDLRQQILDGTFQAMPCPDCGEQVRLPPSFTYLELGRGHWIAVHPPEDAGAWQDAERDTVETFDLAFGPDAPEAARALASDLVPRLVFGWAALQEKLILRDLGLDDAVLELLKVALLHDVGGFALDDGAELRLRDGTEALLTFDWLKPGDCDVLRSLAVPRAAYGAIAADPSSWAGLRERLAGTVFVDVKRAVAEDGTG